MPSISNSDLTPPTSWSEFEDICADLFAQIWKDPNAIRYGRSGQRQDGVDVFGRRRNGWSVGVQCKGKRRWPPAKLTTAEIDKEVAKALKFPIKLTEFIIVTTAEDDRRLQAHALLVSKRHKRRKLFSVHVYGWRELSRWIKDHKDILDKYFDIVTLSAIRDDIQLIAKSISSSHQPNNSDRASPFSPNVAAALERDLQTRYKHATWKAVFPEVSSGEHVRLLGREIIDRDDPTISSSLRRKVLLGASRSAALRGDLDEANRFLLAAQQLTGEESDVQARARILEASGDVAAAVRLLRDKRDADSRSTLLNMLCRHQNDDAAISWFAQEGLEPKDLTGIGLLTLVQMFLRKNDFERAVQTLDEKDQSELVEFPYLLLTRAVVRFASILPVPDQANVLGGIPLDLRSTRPALIDDALSRALDRALSDFRRFYPIAKELDVRKAMRFAEDFSVWCELLHPRLGSSALQKLRLDMTEPERAVSRLQFAFAFDATFDAGPIDQYLARRQSMGGMDDDELVAAFVLRLHGNTPRLVANFIAQYRDKLEVACGQAVVLAYEIEALSKSGNVLSARLILEEKKAALSKPVVDALNAEIAKAEGVDPVQAYLRLFEANGTADSLRSLIGALEGRRDHLAVAQYAEQLYAMTKDSHDIALAAHAFSNAGDVDNFVRVVEAHPFLCETDLKLMLRYARQLFYQGKVNESKALIEKVSRKDPEARDYDLEFAILIETGDWDLMSAPLTSILTNADSFTGLQLIRAAHLAKTSEVALAMPLMRRALAKSPNDAAVLLGAYILSIEEGNEGAEAHEWFRRAIDLSGSDGPIKKFELKDLLAQQLEWQDQVRRVHGLIDRGEVPLVLAAEGLRTTVVDVVLRNFIRNSTASDARQIVPIPLFSGRRSARATVVINRIAIELSGLLTLGWLGILEKALTPFSEIILPAGSLTALFEGKRRIQRSQRSRLQRATQLQKAVARGRIKVVSPPPTVGPELVDSLGVELATLLAAAQTSGGYVLRPAPVHTPKLDEWIEADVSSWSSQLVDMHTLCRFIADALDQDAEQTARSYFSVQDRGWPWEMSLAKGKPLYLDSLALSYLQSAGILDAVLSSFDDIYVASNTKSEAEAIIDHDRHIEDVLRVLDQIRSLTQAGIKSGKITFGPHAKRSRNEQHDEDGVGPIWNLLSDMRDADAVLVDDRALNSELFAEDKRGHRAVTITSLDLIDELQSKSILTDVERRTCRHRLRQAGALLVPVDAVEIDTAARRGRLGESIEFRAIKENINLARASKICRFPSEIPWFASLSTAARSALTMAWKNSDDADRATAIADAILDLLPDFNHWIPCWEGQPPPNWAEAVDRVTIAAMALPAELSMKQAAVYNSWIETTILHRMRLNSPIQYRSTIEHLRSFILGLWDDHEKGS